jgi:hypothetical protein
MSNITQKVTFFYKNIHEKQIFEPVAEEFKKKKIIYNYSKNFEKKAQIGFYCNIPNKINSKISAIFLGGMDQGRVVWPNIWKKEPWHKFDLGFLPGNNWEKRWRKSNYDNRSLTKYGVFNVGWPKADILFNKKKNEKDTINFKRKYKIQNKKINILYAPSFECFNRQVEVAKAVKKNGYNLIIKHWLEKDQKRYKDLWQTIKEANIETLKIYNNKTIIINPEENFLKLLEFVDLIITDESSVAYEALIKMIPTISVKDWKIKRHNKAVARIVKPSDIVIKCTKKTLSKKIHEIIKNKKYSKQKLKNLRFQEFSFLGNSSKIIAQIIIDFLKNKDSIKKSKYLCKPNTKKIFLDKIKNFFKI